MIAHLRRWRCFWSGGHSWSCPQFKAGRWRLVCLTGCGAMTTGVEFGSRKSARIIWLKPDGARQRSSQVA